MALISDVVAGGTIDPAWGNAIRSATVQVTTSGARPSPATEGMFVYETDTDRFMIYDGAAWVRVAAGATAGRTGCTIRKTGNVSVNNGANVVVTWTAEDYDSDGFIAVSSSTVTIPAGLGGLYAVSFSVLFDMTSLATIGTGITATLSGTIRGYHGSVLGGNNTVTSTGTIRTSGMSIVLPMAAADTLSFSAIHSYGSAINLTGAHATVYRIGV
jgi:hypothetical protein